MMIRTEQLKDYDAVYKVVKTAFESAEQSDGNEQDLVNALRKSISFVPELSLVAVIDEKIVGHILFTKIQIGDSTELALAPLSVLPEYQRRGIGKALIAEGHKAAKTLGYNYCVVVGSEKYYPKSGYLPADTFGIQSPFELPRENFMAFKLHENAQPVCGVVQYAKEFGI